jgi:hypothetical protein
MKRNGIDRQPHFFALRMNNECRESVLELKERRNRIDAARVHITTSHIKETPR